MKKVIFLLLFLVLFCITIQIFSDIYIDMYARTLPVEKVYAHAMGYAVLYRKPSGGFAVVYLPFKWFTTAGGRGEIVWGQDASYPYISFFWKAGEFDHVKLYLQENQSHHTWDKLNIATPAIVAKFNVEPEDFQPEF